MFKQKITPKNLIFKKLVKSLLLSCLVINFTAAGLLERLGCGRPAPKSRSLVVVPNWGKYQKETVAGSRGIDDVRSETWCARKTVGYTGACHKRVQPIAIVTGAAIGSLILTEAMMQNWGEKSYLWNRDGSVRVSSALLMAGMSVIGYVRAQEIIANRATK
jgi:hypothetical protein